MNIKTLVYFFITIFSIAFLSLNANAYTITLNAVANAVESNNVFSSPYVTINGIDTNGDGQINDTYYNDSLPTQWETYEDIMTYCDNIASETGLAYEIESGGDVFNNNGQIYQSVSFNLPGLYTIIFAAGSEVYNLGGSTELPWSAYVQIFNADLSLNVAFGNEEPGFISETAALDYYTGYSKSIYLSKAENLYFYINDWNSLDNTGSVTLDIQPAPVPEPATLLLFGSGIIGLAGRRRYQKRFKTLFRKH